MAVSFNQMLEKLHTSMREVGNSTSQLATTAHDADRDSLAGRLVVQETKDTIDKLASNLQNLVSQFKV